MTIHEQKIMRYSFSLSGEVILGTAARLILETRPDAALKLNRMHSNSVFAKWMQIEKITIGDRLILFDVDAYHFYAGRDDMPAQDWNLEPIPKDVSVKAVVCYSGIVPPKFIKGAPFLFVLSLKGPATLVDGEMAP